VSDIAATGKSFSVERQVRQSTSVQWRATSTNGVSYLKLAFDLTSLPSSLRPYLPIFCSALAALNTKTCTLDELDEKIRRSTGGLSASVLVSSSPVSLSQVSQKLVITSNCLDSNIPKMYEMIQEVFTQTAWNDLPHLKTVIQGYAADLMNSLAQSGHSYAMQAASSKLSLSSSINEQISGITFVQFLNTCAKNVDTSLPEISSKLEEIATFLKGNYYEVAINSETSAQSTHSEQLVKLEAALGHSGKKPDSKMTSFNAPKENIKTFYSAPFAVNYTGKSYLGVPYTHSDGPALEVNMFMSM
jgi:Zn-dependent M16 (insulinase) family peptidase